MWSTSAMEIATGLINSLSYYVPSSELNIPRSEQAIDPTAGSMSFALLAFKEIGSKPTLKNHHFVSDSTNKLVVGNASFEKQGYDRRCNGEYSSRKIITLWEKCIKRAIAWHTPWTAKDPIDIEKMISEQINRKSLDEQTVVYRENIVTAVKTGSEEAIESAFQELENHIRQITILETQAKDMIERQQKRQEQIYAIFSHCITGIKKTAETYSAPGQKEDELLQERLKRCIELIERGLKHAPDPDPINNDSLDPLFIEKAKKIWDDETINTIYNYFSELEELSKNPTAINKQHMDDICNSIEEIVNEKCRKFDKLICEI